MDNVIKSASTESEYEILTDKKYGLICHRKGGKGGCRHWEEHKDDPLPEEQRNCNHISKFIIRVMARYLSIQSERLNKPLNELALTRDEAYDMHRDTAPFDLIVATARILLQQQETFTPDDLHLILGDFPGKDGKINNSAYGCAFKYLLHNRIIEHSGEAPATRGQRHGNRAGVYRRGINFRGN